MKQIGDGLPNEGGKEQSSKETPTFDDIYVPGIGVRAALDDDRPTGPGFLSGVAERRIRAVAFLNRRAIRTIENVRGVGIRVANTLRTATAEVRAAAQRPRFRGLLTTAACRTLKQLGSGLLNASGKAHAELGKLSVSTTLAGSAAVRKLCIVGIRSLRFTRSASVPVHWGIKYKLNLPSIPLLSGAIGRNLRRAQSSLRSAVADADNRLRPVNYKVLPRFYASCKLDPQWLLRAVPPLAVLAVIVMFMIEQIATVVRR
jgi:hypothetical protein